MMVIPIFFLLQLVSLYCTYGYNSNMKLPRFTCWGDFEPVKVAASSNMDSTERTNDVIYLRSGMKDLNISCVLISGKGHNSTKNTGYDWSPILNLGQQLKLTLSNTTWQRTYTFPRVQVGKWHISIKVDELSMMGSGFSSDLVEEWMYTVEFDTGAHGSHGTLLLYDRQALTNWKLGVNVGDGEMKSLNPSGLLTQHSPCSGNLWVVVPIIAGDIYLGVTFRAFTDRNLKWYKLTSLITLACQRGQGVCSGELELKGFVVTNYHVVLLTTYGVYVSSKMRIQKSDNNPPTVTWKLVDPFTSIRDKIAVHDIHNNLMYHYNPVCLDPQRTCVLEDYIDLTYSRHDEESIYCKGTASFLDEDWSCVIAASPEAEGHVKQIVYNSHSKYSVILEYYASRSQYHVIIALSTLDKAIFPTFYLPVGVKFTRLRLHPRSMNIFVLGEELWFSSNLGATFERILNPEYGMITDIVFNSGPMHTEVIALANGNSAQPDLYYGTLASRRMAKVGVASKLSAVFLLQNNIKSIRVAKFQSGGFSLSSLAKLNDKLDKRIDVDTSLAIEFTSDKTYYAYEILADADTQLQEQHIGMMLYHISGGQAVISDHRSLENGAQITLKVVESFLTARTDREEMLTEYDLVAQRIGKHRVHVSLQDSDGQHINVWSQEDVGKTIVIQQHSNFLILSLVNTSTMVCGSVRKAESVRASSQTWGLFNFSSETWWLRETQCRQIIQVTPDIPQHMIALDLGSSTRFDVISTRQYTHNNHRTSLYLEYSNPYIFSKAVQDEDFVGYQKKQIWITDRHFDQSLSSLMIYYPYTSLLCDQPSIIYTVLLCCPYHKRIIFNYPHRITPKVLLDEEKAHSTDLLKSLPVNYRPPSALGIAIPQTSNIYNADPLKPLYKSKFKISKESAKFKFDRPCYATQSSPGNSSCGCTQTRRVSRLVNNSDCITEVYKLHLPGQLFLCFAFELLNPTTNMVYMAPIEEIYTITLKELNGRIDYQVELSDSGVARFLPHDMMETEGVAYKTSPYNLKIKMMGSGLYHFQSRVPKHMSYCDLKTEFVVYIDDAPVPYPFLFLMNFGVSIGMGFVMFLVYAGYRMNAKYKKTVLSTHKIATCEHTTKKYSGVPEITTTRAGSRASLGGLMNNRKSQLTNTLYQRRVNGSK